MTEPVALAARGSQRWLQVAVNRRPEVVDVVLRKAMNLDDAVGIEWLSPLEHERYIEYRDSATFKRLGVDLVKPLHDFWPAGGPVWDGLARTSTGELILVEAKAHIAEMISPASRASEASLQRIAASLRATQEAIAPRAQVDWAGTFYQYANRIAHLHYLREHNHAPAHLVFLYFLNATDVGGPSERAEWLGAIKLVEGYLGLGRHRLSKYIHKVFVDVRDLAEAGA